MTEEPSIDPETLAALLDGTLSPEHRTRVLSQLTRSDQAYEDFLEASAVRGGLDQVRGRNRATPLAYGVHASTEVIGAVRRGTGPPVLESSAGSDNRFGNGWKRWSARVLWTAVPLVAAAGIAIVFVARAPKDGSALSILSALPTSRSEVRGSHPDWGTTRGGVDRLSVKSESFRLGVLVVDLDVALRSSDTTDVGVIAGQLESLVSGIPTGGAAVARLRRISSLRPVDAEARERARIASELRTLSASTPWFDLGLWSESARVAARTNGIDFFAPSSAPMQSLFDILAAMDALPNAERRAARPEVDRLRRLIQDPITSPHRLGAVLASLDSTIAEGGR